MDDTYARILSEIDKNDIMEARRALLWLAFSARPLSVEQLAEAAVVDPESDPPFSPENRLLDPHGDILEILGSLVTVSVPAQDDLVLLFARQRRGYNDPVPRTEIKLAHFSVKDYLVSERIQAPKTATFSATPVEGNIFIARSCLLYILHYTESDPRCNFMNEDFYSKEQEKFPLLLCACRLWHIQAEAVPASNRMSVDLIAFKLLLSDTAFAVWLRADPYLSNKLRPVKHPEVLAPLQPASLVDLEGIGRMRQEFEVNTNARCGFLGRNALHIAAERGHEGVVRVLLERNANIEAKDQYGMTALHCAANRGHHSIVRLLLEHSANIEAKEREEKKVMQSWLSRRRKMDTQCYNEQLGRNGSEHQ